MYHYNWNTAKLFQIFDEWSMLMILNATFSVDTFFTMGGLLVAYQLLRTLDKTKGKFNPLLMYLHRYLRLTPTYAILIGIAATLQPYLSTGPSWTIIDVRSGYCRKNWWHNLLYINNLMSVNVTENIQDNYCLGGAWYLGNDFQFFILSPFLIFPLWKWPKIGMGLLGLLSAGSMAVVGVITDVNDLPPSSIPFRQENADEYQKQVYTKPWTRIGPYLVGIWTGFILYKMKQRRSRIPKMVVLLGWILSTTCALGLIFGPKDWFNPTNKIGRWEGVFYASFHRHLWAISIGWIILACVMGSGGIVNKILSWKPFMPLGRLSFCTYLASLEIQMMYSSRVKQSLIYDPFTQTNIFFSHLTLSLFVGFVLTILLESPFMQLEKLAFGRLGEEKRKDNVAVEAHNPEFSLPRAQVPSGTSTYSNFNNNKA
jgi:peptidoglycan/LPS O-acetylase OafA/YrhL